MPPSRTIAVSLGSNLGDRQSHLIWAAEQVDRLLSAFRLSSLTETVPVGAEYRDSPMFLNAAGVGESILTAREILNALLAIEDARGRQRPFVGAPRTLDLDVILVGDEVIDAPGMCVPHPRFREREFVLRPLAEIAPHLRDPVTGLTVGELLGRIGESGNRGIGKS
jgi:2-amino-4-hydroxy-6-hydroxymethyldihydropteridine diphosphokinase